MSQDSKKHYDEMEGKYEPYYVEPKMEKIGRKRTRKTLFILAIISTLFLYPYGEGAATFVMDGYFAPILFLLPLVLTFALRGKSRWLYFIRFLVMAYVFYSYFNVYSRVDRIYHIQAILDYRLCFVILILSMIIYCILQGQMIKPRLPQKTEGES